MVRLGRCLTTLVLALGASASPAIWGRQYSNDPDARPTTPAECLEISLTNPNFIIMGPELTTVNGSSGGTQGDIGFLAFNTATHVVALCRAKNIELEPTTDDQWHNCNVTGLQFRFHLTSFQMHLKASWTCDNSSGLVFNSTGMWEEPLIQGCLDEPEAARGQEILCIMGNSQVPGALSSPVAITPQLPILPFEPDYIPERCPDRSADPQWVVDKFLYQHHEDKSYDVFVDLTNAAVGESVSCHAAFDGKAEVGSKGVTRWSKCTPAAAGTQVLSTEISLEAEYGILGVRQSWTCPDFIEGIDEPRYTGEGYLSARLVCPDQAGASAYNCSLSAPADGDKIRFSGYWPEAPLMPHTTYSRSCTVESFANTTNLTLHEYQTDTVVDAAGKVSLVGTFAVANPGPGDVYRLNRIPVVDDGEWHGCEAAAGEALPWQLARCRYALDRSLRQLSFRFSWYCDDRDPLHPVYFTAAASKELPAEECVVTASGGKSCRLPAGTGAVQMPVATLTWAGTGSPLDRGPTLPWL
ncbi:hypothetical protein B0T14DRAFT_569296 [Immersiella caudata]|uniref:Uncharacterized protein n=1 Tax=Immersiella caudata TaxID=314043 RepID=A0AA40BTL7_9PEZI|nr:hypothetical protein B0T14DRAFT_569296 [Immersiella caudata]